MQALLDEVALAVNTVDKQLSDGFQPTDLFALIPVATSLPSVISQKEAIVSAWKGRSAESLSEWLAYAKTKIDLISDDAEAKTEAILAFAISAVDVYDVFKKAA